MILQYLGGYLQRQRFRVQEGMEMFKRVSEMTVNFPHLHNVSFYEIADCHWRLMEWDQAIHFLELFLESE